MKKILIWLSLFVAFTANSQNVINGNLSIRNNTTSIGGVLFMTNTSTGLTGFRKILASDVPALSLTGVNNLIEGAFPTYTVTGGIVSQPWILSTIPGNTWNGVTYGNGVFVGVSQTGTNRVITSPDGLNWTERNAASASSWKAVCFGNGLFVAVGSNAIMTSPDGINWTSRTSPANIAWVAVTYGNGLFVALANSGTGNRLMTSTDAVTWTTSSALPDISWGGVIYANNQFVAVSSSTSGNSFATSPDGITWTGRTPSVFNAWTGITYGRGLYVVCGQSGTGNRIITSPDGITWTARTSAADNNWKSVTYGNGLFVAVASTGTYKIMTSPNGINWTLRTHSATNACNSVTYGNGVFVGVSNGNALISGFLIDATQNNQPGFSGSGTTTVTGYWPNYTIASSSTTSNVSITGTNITVSGTGNNISLLGFNGNDYLPLSAGRSFPLTGTLYGTRFSSLDSSAYLNYLSKSFLELSTIYNANSGGNVFIETHPTASELQLYVYDSLLRSQFIDLKTSNGFITMGGLTNYSSDYSASYTNRSLTDKGYGDTHYRTTLTGIYITVSGSNNRLTITGLAIPTITGVNNTITGVYPLLTITGNAPVYDEITGVNVTVNGSGTASKTITGYPQTIGYMVNTPEFFDEFVNTTLWTTNVSGTGAGVSTTNIGGTSVVDLNLGVLATNQAGLRRSNNSLALGIGRQQVSCRARFSALSIITDEYSAYFGFSDTQTADAVDGVYFRYLRTDGGDFWECVTSNNSARTVVITTSAISANTDYSLTIVINAAGSSVDFFVNYVNVATITTNIPTGSTRLTNESFYALKSVGTTATHIYNDYWFNRLELTTPR